MIPDGPKNKSTSCVEKKKKNINKGRRKNSLCSSAKQNCVTYVAMHHSDCAVERDRRLSNSLAPLSVRGNCEIGLTAESVRDAGEYRLHRSTDTKAVCHSSDVPIRKHLRTCSHSARINNYDNNNIILSLLLLIVDYHNRIRLALTKAHRSATSDAFWPWRMPG